MLWIKVSVSLKSSVVVLVLVGDPVDPDLDFLLDLLDPLPLWLSMGPGKYMLGFLLNLSLRAMPKEDLLGSFLVR